MLSFLFNGLAAFFLPKPLQIIVIFYEATFFVKRLIYNE